MNILHVEGGARLYGGALQVLYLLQGLAAQGITNTLICRPGCALAERARPFATVCETALHGDLDLGIVVRLGRILRAMRPDVLHLHSRIGADTMGGIAGRLHNVPVVHTRRVDNPEPRWQAALKYRLHDRVIAISHGIAAMLRRVGVPEHKIRVVHSAVAAADYMRPCQRDVVLARVGLPATTRLLGMVAQLIPRKGHRVLLEALPPLLRQHPSLHVLLFGQGGEEQRLRARIAQPDLSGRIHVLGFRDDLADWLPCLEILVHPALREGLGVALLQASAAGVPIVASRVGGIPEAVRDGFNGLLVPPGEVMALRAALARLLAEPETRARFGQAGSVWVREAFSLTAMTAGNVAVYNELVRSGGHRLAA